MRAAAKVGLVAAGYVAAFVVAYVVVAVYVASTSGPDRQTYAAMYDFGDSLLFLAVFLVAAVPATAAALFFLRPHRSFWLALCVVVPAVAITALVALIEYVGARGAVHNAWSGRGGAQDSRLSVVRGGLLALGSSGSWSRFPTRAAWSRVDRDGGVRLDGAYVVSAGSGCVKLSLSPSPLRGEGIKWYRIENCATVAGLRIRISRRSHAMSLKDTPEYYHEVLKRIPPRATPAFEDEVMQARVWGRRWGVYNDVGPLKVVLVHRPGDEIRVMSGDKYDPAIEALIDDEQQWYYRDEKAPDLAKMQGEHDAMVAALETEGAEVVSVGGAPTDPKAMYTRDTAIAVAGGAIICRMGPVGAKLGQGRRGEEAYVMRKLAEIGMPILRTIHGTGLFEGGSFCWLNEHTALVGLSYRQNEEGVRQIEEVLAAQGARLHKIDLAGYAMHIDGQLVMVDQDLALINISRVPWRLLDTLKELKIKWVEVHHADNPRVANVLAVRPGKVLLAINNGDGTAERLVDHGVEVVPIDYSECQKNGGGIHCSTAPLVRERH